MTQACGVDLCDLLDVDRDRLRSLIKTLAAAELTVATAESLTAGLVAATLTEIPGASAVVRGGIVCYATDLKRSLVGVDDALLIERRAVDPDVARQLARGARIRCGANIGIGLTGVAGPDPQDGKPAGTVFIALDDGQAQPAPVRALAPAPGRRSRWEVRAAAVRAALELLAAAAGL